MKIFSRQEVDAVQSHFAGAGHPSFSVDYKGQSYPVFVIDPPVSVEEEPKHKNKKKKEKDDAKDASELPYFVERFSGETLKNGAVFGISSGIRADFRPYPVFQGLIALDSIQPVGRCSQAAHQEVEMVAEAFQPADVQAYLQMRCEYFRALVTHIADRTQEFDVRTNLGMRCDALHMIIARLALKKKWKDVHDYREVYSKYFAALLADITRLNGYTDADYAEFLATESIYKLKLKKTLANSEQETNGNGQAGKTA